MAELQIPIFPLPDVVFFPETVLPLHVFEPRYRRMIADCLVVQPANRAGKIGLRGSGAGQAEKLGPGPEP
ncbi:MAG: LON peptidase substrate-binding domain-containing protein [Candidatus Rokubacteria bacterium]|nr:LON peptidase substrate-binding domain-containing protein [Candidatus Rokubacteria bacterium]